MQHAVRVQLRQSDGRAVEGATVVAEVDGVRLPCTPGDAAGEFRTPLLLPGRCTVRARGAFALVRTEIDVTTEPQQQIAHTVTPAAELTVRALRKQPANGRWVGGLQVALRDAAGQELWTESRQIDTDEPFLDLPLGLAPGSYTLQLGDFVARIAIDAAPAATPARRLEVQLR